MELLVGESFSGKDLVELLLGEPFPGSDLVELLGFLYSLASCPLKPC